MIAAIADRKGLWERERERGREGKDGVSLSGGERKDGVSGGESVCVGGREKDGVCVCMCDKIQKSKVRSRKSLQCIKNQSQHSNI